MNIFQKKPMVAGLDPQTTNRLLLAELVLNSINDGVVIIDQNGLVKLLNPAAARMTGNADYSDALGLSYLSLMKLETGEGMAVPDSQNPLAKAVVNNQAWESRNYYLVTPQGGKTPVMITLTPSGGRTADRIITFRNIAEELAKEGEQTEFISTASHEMRTPVASIEGYLGLALNPQTATIDDRARQYLTEAHNASQHLGKLFQDLLDVTKLDDKRVRMNLVPVDVTNAVREIAGRQMTAQNNKHIQYTFGVEDGGGDKMQIDQLTYAMVDVDFLTEIINNLVGNAIKYTEEGGRIWVSVRADGDDVLINVTDSGIGIPPENLSHIFQKFYRVDNSATRTIGGTGLGLYLAKARTEAMGGRIWAESVFGEGSTFYVALPRISQEEYERQMTVQRNTQMMPIKPPVSPTEVALSGVAVKAVVSQPTPVPQPTTAPQPAVAPVPTMAPAQSVTVARPTAPAQSSQNTTSVIQ
ncbi:PAS domain-containing protein [Candidatus Saccharibacteria bacterium]|nr:PAS domain-containing protein [Candidatus Saccharibacteria bacterium]